MATLKSSVKDSSALVAEYQAKTAVYLEGESDVALFQNVWFMNKLDRLSFRKPDGIGCPAVVREVGEYRISTGLPAFGIVDRDKLVADKKWDLAWETDDAKFCAERPYGEHIRVTKYWEIESYLAQPDAAEDHISSIEKGRPARTREEVENEFLEHAEALIPHAAINSARRLHGKDEIGDTATSNHPDRSAVEEWLAADVRSGKIPADIWTTYSEHLRKAEAFRTGATPYEKLTGLLRRVNGKALIHRIKHRHGLKDDPTFIFAKSIARLNTIPEELLGYINEFSAS